ncbi:MAG: saccharopine dehydrogenase NADP-binding domain-containing protein [Candidatus Aenigmarchaeota archaeon]|nr:saccharopine dehydrogenase NADP-binding domain-containing protein [Candidatus Aenigmarchaeota archaeon]
MDLSAIVLGAGRIGVSIAYALSKYLKVKRVGIVSNKKEELEKAKRIVGKGLETFEIDVMSKKVIDVVKDYDVVVGALPGSIGTRSFEVCIQAHKNLVDVSDLDYVEYKKFGKLAKKKGISFIPEAGFSPGLSNLLVGYEYSNVDRVEEVCIKAGTLPKKGEKVFPVTWCFSDLVTSQRIKPTIVKNYKKINLNPFSGYTKEKLPELGEVESFYIENLSTLPMTINPRNMSYRVLRPLGFRFFFEYLDSYGFLEDKEAEIDGNKINLFKLVEKVLTFKEVDNYTVLFIDFKGRKGKRTYVSKWQAMSFSKKREKFNSMQKIVSASTSLFVKILVDGYTKPGINLTETLGREENIKTLKTIFKKSGIKIRRSALS